LRCDLLALLLLVLIGVICACKAVVSSSPPLSTALLRYPQKIYENLAFNRSQSLSVEIIEEKNLK
jgi:hypothetical protein